MSVSRRAVLKSVVGAGVAAAGLASAAEAERREPPADAVGMLYDATLCIGCKACVAACHEANGLAPDRRGIASGLYDAPEELSSTTKNIIKLYDGEHGRSFMKAQCMHCVDPACCGACMLGALQKREHGIVSWDGTKCVGCRYCQMACPFNIPKFEWFARNPRIIKCEMCRHLLKDGGIPACCDVCPKGAVIFGPRTELLEEAHRRLAEHPERYVGKIYGEHDGGGTQVLYLSHVPFEDLGLPELGDRSQAELARTVQHGTYKWVVGPVAVVACLGVALGIRERLRSGAEDE